MATTEGTCDVEGCGEHATERMQGRLVCREHQKEDWRLAFHPDGRVIAKPNQ